MHQNKDCQSHRKLILKRKSHVKEGAELPLQYLPGVGVLNKEMMNLMIMMMMILVLLMLMWMMTMLIPGLVFEVQGPCSAS